MGPCGFTFLRLHVLDVALHNGDSIQLGGFRCWQAGKLLQPISVAAHALGEGAKLIIEKPVSNLLNSVPNKVCSSLIVYLLQC